MLPWVLRGRHKSLQAGALCHFLQAPARRVTSGEPEMSKLPFPRKPRVSGFASEKTPRFWLRQQSRPKKEATSLAS